MPRLAGLLLALLLSHALPAEACDCLTGSPEPLEALRVSAAVFEGRVLAASPERTELLVERAWKGAVAGERVVIASDGSSCGYHFVVGDRALIYAPRVAGALRIVQCDPAAPSRVAMDAEAVREAAVLGPATSVRPPGGAACSCTATELAAQGTLESFEAKVLGVNPRGGRRWIDVQRTSRAPVGQPRTWTLLTPADACGVDVLPGARVLVRGLRTSVANLTVGACVAGSGLTPQSRRLNTRKSQ